jgi:hypothetical protein
MTVTMPYEFGKPITLKFADAIGEVLVTRPVSNEPPLPFMYYI